jgi:hypothetical protein
MISVHYRSRYLNLPGSNPDETVPCSQPANFGVRIIGYARRLLAGIPTQSDLVENP